MNEPKKLKRGLKDISPLFREERSFVKPQVVEQNLRTGYLAQEGERSQTLAEVSEMPTMTLQAERKRGIQTFSVLSENPELSFRIQQTLAERLAANAQPCILLSIENIHLSKSEWTPQPAFSGAVNHWKIGWSELEQITHARAGIDEQSKAKPETPWIFLDFPILEVPSYDKFVPFIDKSIFHVKPTLESLTETYKLMKALSSINQRMEYYILFNGAANDVRAGILFEKFSEIVARRLGIHLVWLGTWSVSPEDQQRAQIDIQLEPLFFKSISENASIEKQALVHHLLSHYELETRVAG